MEEGKWLNREEVFEEKGAVGEIKIDGLPSVSDFLCFLPLLLFNEICASPSLHVLFIYLFNFFPLVQWFIFCRWLAHLLMSITNIYCPTLHVDAFHLFFLLFLFPSALLILLFHSFFFTFFIVILFAFPSLSFCLVLSLYFCIFIFISPLIFLLLRVCSSNWKWFVADRELELRELRKVVLMSQEENMTLNKDMEELKVFISSL